MLSLALALFSFISLLIWIVLTFFHGGFWRLRACDDDVAGHERLKSWPAVIAIVPARNEATTIAQTVESLVAQTYPGRLQIIVVNDHSEDATAEIVRRISEADDVLRLVSILESEALPDGWTGKIWAMRQGARTAAEIAPEYLWFTDADIVHAPDTLERLVSRAEPQNLDLVSLMVLLQAKSIAERLLIPAFLYFFLTLYVPKWIANPKSGTAGAAGGCVLLRRSALDRIGGFAAIRTEVIDDCALARAVKHSGGAIWMGLTRGSVSLRSYSTFSEIGDLIARTAFTQLNYSLLILLGTLVGLVFTYLLPVLAVLSGQTLALLVGIAAWVLMSVTYFPTVKFYGLPGWWAPLLPAAAAFYTYATCLSAMRYWLGRGGQWKGRAQAPVGR